jgi:phosphopantetheinyl transferase
VQAALKEEQLRRAEAEVTRWLVVDECWWWWLMVLIMWDDVRWWLKDTKRAWRLKFEDAWGWWKVLTYWILYDLF